MMRALISRTITNNNGVALLLAVTVISLLIALTVQFSKDMRQELIGSANYLAASKLGTMVKSGYNIGAALLQVDGGVNEIDSYHDGWAKVASDGLANLYGTGSLSINITDLGGRIQLNSLIDEQGKAGDAVSKQTRTLLKNLFLTGRLGDYGDEEIELILDSITDWIDADDDEIGIDETESSFYQSLQPSYRCKNGPIEFIEELLLIRGITTDLYYGNAEFAGLKDLVTAHGNDGKVNINTAPSLVLQALSTEMNEELAADLIEFRGDEENEEQLGGNWYTTILPGDVNLPGAAIALSSNYFQITATAERNDMEKNLYAVVQRQAGNAIALVSRKVE